MEHMLKALGKLNNGKSQNKKADNLAKLIMGNLLSTVEEKDSAFGLVTYVFKSAPSSRSHSR